MGYELVSIDEASFQLQTSYKRIWFPKGEKPKRAFFWSNKKLIVFGALTSSSKFYYDFFCSQNSFTVCCFLRNLFDRLDSNKKYVLIFDNAGFHKTDVVQEILEKQKDFSQHVLILTNNWKLVICPDEFHSCGIPTENYRRENWKFQ